MKRRKLAIGIFVLAVTLWVPGLLFAQKIKVGYWTSGFSLGFGAVMEQLKFAEKEGLNVEWVKFAEVNGPTRAIVSNAIDVAFAAPSTNSIGIAADGVPVKIVLATQIAEAQIVVPEGSPVKAITDLKGKKSACHLPAAPPPLFRTRLYFAIKPTNTASLQVTKRNWRSFDSERNRCRRAAPCDHRANRDANCGARWCGGRVEKANQEHRAADSRGHHRV